MSGSSAAEHLAFVQVLALVRRAWWRQLITVLVNSTAQARSDVYRLSEVAHVLGGGQPAAAARPLVTRVQRRAPRDLYRSVVRTGWSDGSPPRSARRRIASPSFPCSATAR